MSRFAPISNNISSCRSAVRFLMRVRHSILIPLDGSSLAGPLEIADSLDEKSSWIRTAGWAGMAVEHSPARTQARWIDQLHTQRDGWRSILLKRVVQSAQRYKLLTQSA